MGIVGALLTLAILLGIFRMLSPTASRSVTRTVLPRADRSPTRQIEGQTERRGAVLAAVAAADLGGLYDASGSEAVFVLGLFFAVAFRFAPKPTGAVLALIGLTSVLISTFGDSCVGVTDDRTALAIVLPIAGIAAYAVLGTMFSGAGIARGGSVSLLVLFGIAQLGLFVAAPFGLDLANLVGLGGSLAAIIGLYFAIVAGAALLPELTAGAIGICCLAATLSVDSVVDLACGNRQGAQLAVLVGFALVWWIAGAMHRRASQR